MKKLFSIIAILSIALSQNGFSQDNTKTQSSLVLQSYYDIKNALVAGNAKSATFTVFINVDFKFLFVLYSIFLF